jgi:hypothetical protein
MPTRAKPPELGETEVPASSAVLAAETWEGSRTFGFVVERLLEA